jgi:Flp pilus assembly protein TadD
VTTSSLDALRKFTEARYATLGQADYTRAVGLLREAVQIDSTFAMAYRQLTISLADSRLGTILERQATFAKAYLLRDRLPEVERLAVEAYNFNGIGPHPDRAKYVAAYEALVERYPETPGVRNLLANEFEARGDWARAESTWKLAQIGEPSSQFPLLNDARSKMHRGAFAEARR